MKKKILIVDDEEGIRKVLGIALDDMGYEVLLAEDGAAALEVFKKELPPVVLTDIKMPVMDGINLLQKIKRDYPDTQVIMLTGHGDMDLAIKCIKLAATDFITKPINDEILEIALNRAHEKITMQQQLKEYTQNLEQMVAEKSARLVEAERLLAVGQAMEGFSTTFRNIAGDLNGNIRYFNEMPCLVSIHDRNLKIIAANALFKDRIGEKIGVRSWDIFTDEHRSKESCPAARTFQLGKGQRCQARLGLADGASVLMIVHTAPIHSATGDVELVIEVAVDIAEIQRLQEELRLTHQRYHQLFDEAPCYITLVDRSFNITAANKRFQEDFEYTVGAHCFSAYKKQTAPCSECPVTITFADGKSHQIEMEVISKSGEKYHLLIWTAPIKDAAGNITQVMEMATNITQVRKLQDQLSSLGLLIGSVSHGIKGLLTGLDGGMYLVDSGFAKENQDQIKEGWELVQFMVARIRSMVLDILYYAKEKDLKWEKVDVFSFANELVQTITPKLKGEKILLETRFEPALGNFEVDAGIVHSALINILQNAVEACRIDPDPKDHKIRFEIKQKDDFIEFRVQDNGIGMDEDTRRNIFKPFSSSRGNQGTGMGLYISNRIIGQHGGEIQLKSAPGQGSDLKIRMPKSLPESIRTSLKERPAGPVKCSQKPES